MLRDKLQQMLPADEKGGFIIRTMAETATDAELLADIQYLRKLWQRHPRAQRRPRAAPSLLYQDLSLAQRVLRDFVNEDTDRILIDSRENFSACRRSRATTCRTCCRGWSTTPASGRCSTCTTSRTKSRRRWRAAST